MSILLNQAWNPGLMELKLMLRVDTTLRPKSLRVRAKVAAVTLSHNNHVWTEESGLDRGASAINSQQASGFQHRGIESAVRTTVQQHSVGQAQLGLLYYNTAAQNKDLKL